MPRELRICAHSGPWLKKALYFSLLTKQDVSKRDIFLTIPPIPKIIQLSIRCAMVHIKITLFIILSGYMFNLLLWLIVRTLIFCKGNSSRRKIFVVVLRFQSTLPHGERLVDGAERWYKFWFQSTLPHGERQVSVSVLLAVTRFNPHSHTGSDRCTDWHGLLHQGFNPHSHAGSDTWWRQDRISQRVSIHTPTRGVTVYPDKDSEDYTPFQSTLPRGEWRVISDPLYAWADVSIHTPTRGVTSFHP